MKATLDLPEELIRRAEVEAARAGVTVEEALRRALEVGLPREPEAVIDWARFSGTLKLGADPLEFQRSIREEWS